MKIGVLVKQVPDTETRIKLAASGGIDEGDIKWVINPFDEYALEEALKLREKAGGEVVVVSAGSLRATDAIRQALAMGADRGIRLDTEGVNADGYLTAKMLSKVVKEESFDMIFAGKQAVDDDASIVVQFVGEFCDIPHVLPIESFNISDDLKTVKVERPISGGSKEVIEVTLPAIFGCEKGLNTPRYATLPNIMKAKAKPIAVKSGAELCDGAVALSSVVALKLPPERSAGRRLTGDVQKMTDELIHFLRDEAKVI